MSKLYQKYQELKKQNPEKSYLFKSGIFYIFLDEDAKKLSPILNLKITNLNETVVKCGFPVNTIQKYLNIFKTLPYEIELVETSESKPISNTQYSSLKNYEEIASELCKINIDGLSISEAFAFLEKLQKKANLIFKEN